jgi:hypothetical protein
MFYNHYGKRNFMLLNFLPSVNAKSWDISARCSGPQIWFAQPATNHERRSSPNPGGRL